VLAAVTHPVAWLARNRRFESISLQRGVMCEPESSLLGTGRNELVAAGGIDEAIFAELVQPCLLRLDLDLAGRDCSSC
jgi:hypothetical protein